jgi:two-component system C4-dicarboxylate transport sensor histidine kinase DctB
LTLADQTLGHGALTPLNFQTPSDGRSQLVEAPIDGAVRHWMHASSQTATPGWTLHLLTPTRGAIEAAVANARAIAVLIITLVFGVLAVLLRRRQQAAARHRAAEAARQDLEHRIAERTRDLREANEALNRQIEERMRAEASREALRDELVQAGKLAALGQIAAGVAHEINQPVAAILTQAETAAAWLERDQVPKAARALSRIGDLTTRIGAITQELRAFSRKSQPSVSSVSINEAVDGALLLLGGRLRQAGVRLVRDKGPDAFVMADRFRLEQVIVNLIQNALEALEGVPTPIVTLSVKRVEDQVQLIVADNGPGLPEAIRRQLFTPFVTSKANGLGLGLVISRDIIVAFKGELDLRPSDTGTVFVVALRSA